MSAAPDEFGDQLGADLAALDLRSDLSWMTDNPDKGLPYTWERDYPAVKAPETVVHNLIERGSLAVIFGESNTGKSTFALDVALAVARPETAWRDRVTEHGVVLWIALESAAGLRRRVVAYRKHHGVEGPMLFADITVPVRLLDVKDVEAIIHTARVLALVAGLPVQLILVDTVHRALGGGDENDGRDIGTLVRGCDLIRQRTGAAVVLIHHSGKDSTRGARGHSSLRAAVDTEIEVSGQVNPRQAKVTKQRDLPSGDVLAFNLDPIEIATDPATGQPVTACVVSHKADGPPSRALPSGSNQRALLAAIKEHVRAKGSDLISSIDLRDIAKGQGLTDRRRFAEAREALERDGWIAPCVGGHLFKGDKL